MDAVLFLMLLLWMMAEDDKLVYFSSFDLHKIVTSSLFTFSLLFFSIFLLAYISCT
jgi:hypothetical protein